MLGEVGIIHFWRRRCTSKHHVEALSIPLQILRGIAPFIFACPVMGPEGQQSSVGFPSKQNVTSTSIDHATVSK